MPLLLQLSLDALSDSAGLPGSKMIPAAHALRACLALKLWSIERKSHVMALVADKGLALFAGLNAFPKKSYLSEYSSRISHAQTLALLGAYHKQLGGQEFLPGHSFNLQTVPLEGQKFRQLFILDLGHEEPTVLLTNDRHSSAPKLITRYAQRMLIENALSDAVRFFHLDALSSAVGLKVAFDMALLVIASGAYRLFARKMRGYADAQARVIFRDLIDMPATVDVTSSEVQVRFHRRAHLPIVLASGLLNAPVTVPWWNDMRLRLTA